MSESVSSDGKAEGPRRRAVPGDWEWIEGNDEPKPAEQPASSSAESEADSTRQRERRNHWPPRTCRICLETVQPTFTPVSNDLPSMFNSRPEVIYESEEGRLIRPCKCKGTQRYVHENCLREWRHTDPFYGRTNYYQCPTCKFQYRLGRMSLSRVISSTIMQMILTVIILLLAVFILGFVGDFILAVYLDPFNTLFGTRHDFSLHDPNELSTWGEHLLKGLASIGVIGLVQPLLYFRSYHFRLAAGGTTRNVRTGRERLSDLTWVILLIGVLTFLWWIWKATKALSRRYLNKVADRVLDVQGDDDGDDDD